jgi:Tfp pilus assembly protein, ATPase PilU
MEIEVLLKLMVDKLASDLFVTVGVPPSIKVHGKVIPVGKNYIDRRVCPQDGREHYGRAPD